MGEENKNITNDEVDTIDQFNTELEDAIKSKSKAKKRAMAAKMKDIMRNPENYPESVVGVTKSLYTFLTGPGGALNTK